MPSSSELQLPNFEGEVPPAILEWARKDINDTKHRGAHVYNFNSVPGAQAITVIHNPTLGSFNEHRQTIGGTMILDVKQFWNNLDKYFTMIPEIARDMTFKWIVLAAMLNNNPEATEAEK